VDLSPGESATFTGSYALSQADIDAIYLDNVIDNVASATGQDPNDEDVTSNEDPAQITVTPTASLSIVKDPALGGLVDEDDNGLDEGDTLNYTFLVTNTGDVTVLRRRHQRSVV